MRKVPVPNDPLATLFDSRWESRESLRAWAHAAGIDAELADPAMLALGAASDERVADELRRAITTMEELAVPGAGGFGALQARLGAAPFSRARAAARAYLDDKAFVRLGLVTPRNVDEHWARAQACDPALGPLLERLRTLRTQLPAPTTSQAARLQSWEFAEEPSSLRALVSFPGEAPWEPRTLERITLKLRGAPEPWCSCRAYACTHVALALDAIVDALFDGSRGFAEDLRAIVTAPEWKRALGRLDTALARMQAGPSTPEDPPSRIAWKIAPTRSGIPQVSALLQKRTKDGRYSAGTLLRYHDHQALEAGDPRDRRVLRALDSIHGWVPEELRDAVSMQALRDLCGHPLVFLAGRPMVHLDLRAARLQLALDEQDDGSLSLRATADGAPAPTGPLLDQLRAPGFDGFAVLLDEEAARCIVAQVDPKVREVMLALGAESNTFPAEAAPDLLERASRLASVMPMRIPERLLGDEVPGKDDALVRVERSGPVSLRLQILVVPAPGGAAVVPGEGMDAAPGTIEGRRIFVRRRFAAERDAAERARARLLLPDSETFTWSIQGDDALDLLARLGALPAGDELRVEWLSDRWKVTSAAQGRNVSVKLAPKRDWLGLTGTIEVDGAQLQLAEALDAARRGARYVQASADTWIALGDELRARLALVADLTFAGRGGLEASIATLPALEALVEGGGAFEAAREFTELIDRIRSSTVFEPDVPEGVKAELRPYQVDGFRWLARLAEWGGGGCLADDMGLGKTLQTLALLVHRQHEGPALVIAPTSVCGGWVREAERFTPSLRPLVFGDLPDHERAAAVAALGPGDVLVVSYTFLARERELLCGRPFATLVLDEGQAIKNAQTERAKAARALQAGVRIVLSGTPLENHVGELWSLFQVAVPGLLGSWEQFRQRFALPIERGDSAERREALSRVLRPFLLRRTKKEVAAELPPRTEIDEFVEPSRAERELYEQARLAAVARVKGVAGSMPPEKARFEVLAAITRLRLVSCHPALYDPESTVPSSKLERIVELLGQLREEGHRALVFSQFTSHLGLVREALEEAGLRVLYLDGRTPGGERQALVDSFQAGEADHFLISLKAGGSGLNLTAADFVLHLDPWWNPAVEDQASDRAHRIGQTRPVTVIRLIARKTIEEQILSLHAQKRELVASILDGSGAAGGLDTADLMRLIEGSAFEAGPA